MARHTQVFKDRDVYEVLMSEFAKLMLFSPLYGTVFTYAHKIETYDMPTMAVGTTPEGTDIAFYYNPNFVRELLGQKLNNTNPLQAVLKHEALHLLLHHIQRARHYNMNARGYNVAADMAINTHITGLPESALLPKQFNLPDNETAEYYYDAMKKKGEDEDLILDEYLDRYGVNTLDDHSLWGSFENDIIKEKIREIAKKAIGAQEAKGWGTESGSLVQQIINANKPVVNWKTEVRYFINQFIRVGRRSTRMRPNRRYGYSNPGTKRDFKAKLLVAVDTSGSVSDEMLKEFFAEINGMIQHVEVHLIQFDTVIHGPPIVFNKKTKKLDIKGRGGTDFRPAIELADTGGYNGLIMLTDGWCDYPPKPKCRVLWALPKSCEEAKPPYGKKVIIDAKRKH